MSGVASRQLITKRTRMQQVEGLVNLQMTKKVQAGNMSHAGGRNCLQPTCWPLKDGGAARSQQHCMQVQRHHPAWARTGPGHLVERHFVADVLVQHCLARHIPVYQLWHLGHAECRASKTLQDVLLLKLP